MRGERIDDRQIERIHYLRCDWLHCERCQNYARGVAQRQQRKLNLIFSTLWVAIGAAVLVAMAFRICGA